MTLNIETLSWPEIIQSIARNMGWEDGEDIEPYKDRIENLTPEKAFAMYCTWHGLIGWGDRLWAVVHRLEEATR